MSAAGQYENPIFF